MSDRIIIHGASSFLGKHFLEALEKMENKKVLILARENSGITPAASGENIKIFRYKKNIEELTEKSFKDFYGGVFFDFTWQGVFGSERNNPEQLTVNIPLTISSLEFAKHIKTKHWISCGSQAEYGNQNKKLSEEDGLKPKTLYGRAKVISSQIARELCEIYKIDYSWVRIFSLYGPGDNHGWFIQYIINKMLKNETLEVTEGEQYWDYLYVKDAVKALIKLIDRRGAGVINLASGKAVKIKDIILKAKEITGSDSEIKFGAMPYREDQVMYMEGDITKINNLLRWKPEINLSEGLKETIDFIRKNL